MAEEMHDRVTRQEISLVRGGARILVRTGETFRFTAEEVADLERRRLLRPAPASEPESAPVAEHVAEGSAETE